jgi:hypothetical protein
VQSVTAGLNRKHDNTTQRAPPAPRIREARKPWLTVPRPAPLDGLSSVPLSLARMPRCLKAILQRYTSSAVKCAARDLRGMDGDADSAVSCRHLTKPRGSPPIESGDAVGLCHRAYEQAFLEAR